MTRPFKFRYVNEIVGVFVLLIGAVVIAGIWGAGVAQGWFDEQKDLVVLLPSDVPTGLRDGSDVEIFGTSVGTVRDIRVSPAGEMAAAIRVRGDLIHFVRSDSEAIIRKKLAVAGDAYIEITRGTGDELGAGDRIPARIDEDVTSLVLQTLRDVSDAARFTLFQVNQLLGEYTSLARSLEPSLNELALVLREARGIAESLRNGEGSAGRLLTDDALFDASLQVFEDLRETLGRVDEVLTSARDATDSVPAVTDEAASALDQVRATLAEVERLVQGLQNHWALRKYVPADSTPGPLPAPGLLEESP